MGTWVNSNMHIAAWKAIKDEGVWDKYDWTVKSDIDAIFIPIRLRQKLEKIEVTDNGIYLENCKWEYYGFFGALEVISHDGAGTLMNSLDDCKSALNYKEGQKSSGMQPWGEDLFIQRCMDLTKLLLTTSALMLLAKHIGQRTRGKTQSGSPIAQQRKPLESITSKNQKITSTASRQLNVELAVVKFCMRYAALRDNECFTMK